MIAAVNTHIQIVKFQFVFKRYCKECTWYQSAFIATSLDKLENKVQVYHLHPKHFHMVKRLRTSVQYILSYSTMYAYLRCYCTH